ncbi:MAG TPA: putative molybdenum carrier protein [Lamprocystis sp. (in: g-proteobacteria)]|nr:putative molybdenum carrier protein [Lamprocystis sp. (in: g-proteobacteria)]
MSGFVDKLKLKERAEEDQYFARQDQALLAALRHREAPKDATRRVFSGGQTGVDRAALEAALALGLPIGGWCPAGRLAEDGPIPTGYALTPTPSTDDATRTEWNVRDSDATLILHRGDLAGGTRLTIQLSRRWGRPLLLRNLDHPVVVAELVAWLRMNSVRVLNCAGPRESECPGIQAQAQSVLSVVFGAWQNEA